MPAEYPKPPYPSQKQPMPGATAKMDPRPDHGETSYKGSGRLRGMKAVITGGDSGIGRAVAIAYAREGADILIAYLSEDNDANEGHWQLKTGQFWLAAHQPAQGSMRSSSPGRRTRFAESKAIREMRDPQPDLNSRTGNAPKCQPSCDLDDQLCGQRAIGAPHQKSPLARGFSLSHQVCRPYQSSISLRA
jgi:hypothetical protein